MATENGADGATADAGTTDQEQMDKFAGFATRDGEVQKPAVDKPAGKQNANAKPIGEKGKQQARAQENADDDDGGEVEGKHADAGKRIGQAVGRQRAAERRADRAEADNRALSERLARLEGVASAGGLTAKSGTATAPKAPDVKDYEGGEYDARYLADVAKFEARKAVAEAKAEVRTETQQGAATAEQQRIAAAFNKARDEFATAASEDYPDFEEVVFSDDNPVSKVLADLSLDSDYGARILYELAEDHTEAVRVSKLSPARQAAWFGRQEAALEDSSDDTDAGDGGEGDGEKEQRSKRQSGPKAKVSNAPAVPDYNARGSGAVPKTSAATPDFAAFERMATASQKKQ